MIYYFVYLVRRKHNKKKKNKIIQANLGNKMTIKLSNYVRRLFQQLQLCFLVLEES